MLKASAAMLGSVMPGEVLAQAEVQPQPLRLFLCGDVMTGRGIDQVLPHPSDPRLHERHAKSALRYVELAERANGPIEKPVSFSYIWGDASGVLVGADVRIINLETTVSKAGAPVPKGINYRMHPSNLMCIKAAGIDCCVLSNNHAIDWGRAGLIETLDNLREVGLKTAGAGRNEHDAARPAICDPQGKGRVLIFGFGCTDSGIPSSWAASSGQSGVNLFRGTPQETRDIARKVKAVRQPLDIVVASIHWGSNWGYRIPSKHRELAHELIDEAGVDIVHGHSSHHVKGIEVHRGKLILFGCGDLINDYEGIGGHRIYRGDLALTYSASVSPADGKLLGLEMVPLQMRRFRLSRATKQDTHWLEKVLTREGEALNTRAEPTADGTLTLRWQT